IRRLTTSISKGSWPTTHSAKPRQILCESGASMIALATAAEESTSPTPIMPASVCTLTTSVSWLPSQRSLISGSRRWIASTRVIFIDNLLLAELPKVDFKCLNLALQVQHQFTLLLNNIRRRLVHEA